MSTPPGPEMRVNDPAVRFAAAAEVEPEAIGVNRTGYPVAGAPSARTIIVTELESTSVRLRSNNCPGVEMAND